MVSASDFMVVYSLHLRFAGCPLFTCGGKRGILMANKKRVIARYEAISQAK
jgi:hypothetical protein